MEGAPEERAPEPLDEVLASRSAGRPQEVTVAWGLPAALRSQEADVVYDPPAVGSKRQRGLELAYRYINRRERTVGEVRRHLHAKELDDSAVEETIDELVELGLLDDARFARVFTQDKRELEQWGVDRIRQALHTRGIDRELIDANVGGAPDEQTELERAIDLLRRRFPTPLGDGRARDRALGVLMRKGYDADTALEAIRGHGTDSV